MQSGCLDGKVKSIFAKHDLLTYTLYCSILLPCQAVLLSRGSWPIEILCVSFGSDCSNTPRAAPVVVIIDTLNKCSFAESQALISSTLEGSVIVPLVNQWLNFTYSRSHDFRYGRKNTNFTFLRIKLTTSALAGVQVTY